MFFICLIWQLFLESVITFIFYWICGTSSTSSACFPGLVVLGCAPWISVSRDLRFAFKFDPAVDIYLRISKSSKLMSLQKYCQKQKTTSIRSNKYSTLCYCVFVFDNKVSYKSCGKSYSKVIPGNRGGGGGSHTTSAHQFRDNVQIRWMRHIHITVHACVWLRFYCGVLNSNSIELRTSLTILEKRGLVCFIR